MTLLFLMAASAAQAQGSFTCMGAATVAVPSVNAGNIAGAPNAPDDGCSESSPTGPGVWFALVGNGNLITLSTCVQEGGSATFNSQITVYSGPDCNTLACVAGNDIRVPECSNGDESATFTWCSTPGEQYWVVVSKSGLANEGTTFDLAVVDGARCTSLCPQADPVAVPSVTMGATQLDDIIGNSLVSGAPFCCTLDEPTAPVDQPDWWYVVTGTGRQITASTCPALGGDADFDTVINVYCRGCDTPQCVAVNDEDNACGGAISTVTWCSELDVEYLVLVHGYQQSGNFALAILDGVECDDPPFCGEPVLECCGPCEVLSLLAPILPSGSLSSTHPCLIQVEVPPAPGSTSAPTFIGVLPEADPEVCCPYFLNLALAIPGVSIPSTHPCFVAPEPPISAQPPISAPPPASPATQSAIVPLDAPAVTPVVDVPELGKKAPKAPKELSVDVAPSKAPEVGKKEPKAKA